MKDSGFGSTLIEPDPGGSGGQTIGHVTFVGTYVAMASVGYKEASVVHKSDSISVSGCNLMAIFGP